MTRWSIALGAAILAALLVLHAHHPGAGLLQDTDTKVLLQTIRAKNAPFSWFWSDWPLYNHFYRPIPTLTFEFDSRMWGDNPAGYAWTNAVLAATSVLCLFWFLREFTDRPLGAALGTLLFAYWQTSPLLPLASLFGYLAWLTLIVGAVRHRKDWRAYVPAFLVLLYLGHEVLPIQALQGRMLDWLPGRTASSMTVFALIAMAAYARYERLGPKKSAPEPTPLDPPATRSTKQASKASTRWPWGVLAVVTGALAFASYEQAVMLPACLLAVALSFYWMGYRPSWGWQVAFWGLLLAYLGVRHQVIPPGVSGYQKQQLRTTQGALLALLDFAYPLGTLQNTWFLLIQGWFVLLDGSLYLAILTWTSAVVTFWELRREWILAFAGWGMSILAFLPMAWLKIFEHYYYWPMALRTVFVIALGSVAWRLLSTAWCPPAVQAPPRPSPAPGSLLHP